MPRVSVIIPSYNHEKYVAEAIQSVLDQSYQDFEIVITDDGSNDNTVDVIKQFTDSRIKLFVFDKNLGASIATNHCIKNSTGEFVALLNSDDVWLPNKLEKQVQFLDKHPDIGAVFSYSEFIDENSQLFIKEHFYTTIFQQPNRTRFEWLNYFFYRGNCLCHPSILIRKECYDTVGLYDPRYAQLPDFDFWIRLCQKYEIHIIVEKLIRFRLRDNEANASGQRPETLARHSVELCQIYKNFLSPTILENLSLIFPEVNQIPEFAEAKNFSRDTLAYFVAKLALTNQFKSVHYFGINVLFDLLNPSNLIDSEKIKYLITYKNLINITGELDPFSEQDQRELILFKNSLFFRLRKIWLTFKSKL
jgi:glycosyltransferase involved in cell wall biosynthesis